MNNVTQTAPAAATTTAADCPPWCVAGDTDDAHFDSDGRHWSDTCSPLSNYPEQIQGESHAQYINLTLAQEPRDGEQPEILLDLPPQLRGTPEVRLSLGDACDLLVELGRLISQADKASPFLRPA